MRSARPSLVLTDAPSYSTPFFADPWPVSRDGGSPSSELSASDCSYGHGRSEASTSNSSSRTSSTHSHVIPESTFLTRGKDGHERYLVDPYFGYKDIALLSSSFLTKSFNSMEETESSRRLKQPSLSVFIAQIIHLTGVPMKVVMATLILLHRFHQRISSEHKGGDLCFSGHRLFMAGFMLACNDENVKGLGLDAQSAAYWSEISLFPEQELDDAFNDVYDQLEGNTVVFPSYAAYLEKLNNPVSIKSFEGDLDFFSSDDLDLLDDDDDDDPSQQPSKEVLSGPKAVSITKRNNNGRTKVEAVKLAPPRMSVRTKISSLFGRRAKSPKLDD